jgi:hypothetical protein
MAAKDGRVEQPCADRRRLSTYLFFRILEKTTYRCAGINRHEERMKEPYEKGVAIRSASSLALGIVRYTAKRRQRIGGVGIHLRKDAIRTPTSLLGAEGNMNSAIARAPAQSGVVEDPRHA